MGTSSRSARSFPRRSLSLDETHRRVLLYVHCVCMFIVGSSCRLQQIRHQPVWLPILLVVSSTGIFLFCPLSPFAPENLVSQDRFSRAVPRHPLILHSQAESVNGAYSYSRAPLLPLGFHDRVHLYRQPPSGPVPSLSGHAITYRWRSLLRVRRHRTTTVVLTVQRKSGGIS